MLPSRFPKYILDVYSSLVTLRWDNGQVCSTGVQFLRAEKHEMSSECSLMSKTTVLCICLELHESVDINSSIYRTSFFFVT